MRLPDPMPRAGRALHPARRLRLRGQAGRGSARSQSMEDGWRCEMLRRIRRSDAVALAALWCDFAVLRRAGGLITCPAAPRVKDAEPDSNPRRGSPPPRGLAPPRPSALGNGVPRPSRSGRGSRTLLPGCPRSEGPGARRGVPGVVTRAGPFRVRVSVGSGGRPVGSPRNVNRVVSATSSVSPTTRNRDGPTSGVVVSSAVIPDWNGSFTAS
jgi:hypothetical protein